MAKNKTNETNQSVSDFVNALDNELKRKDSYQVIELMKSATGFEAKMWGPSIIGFGHFNTIKACFSAVYFAFSSCKKASEKRSISV